MARARSIKPGYFKNEELSKLHPLTRILFAGLWVIADREGRLEDRPERIKVEVLPYDRVNVNRMLEDLAKSCFITRYEIEARRYIQINTFRAHQSPHRDERPSTIPAPYKHGAEHHTSMVQTPQEHHTKIPSSPTACTPTACTPTADTPCPPPIADVDLGTLPETVDVMTEVFPTTDPTMVLRVVGAARAAVPDVSDAELASALRKTWKRDQESAALWLKTVPVWLQNTRRRRRPPEAASPPKCGRCGESGIVGHSEPLSIVELRAALDAGAVLCSCAAGTNWRGLLSEVSA